MTVEFDPLCGTAQPEDVLRLLIPNKAFQSSGFGSKNSSHEVLNSWIELKKFSGSIGWPATVLVLPGIRNKTSVAYALLKYGNLIKIYHFYIGPAIEGDNSVCGG